MKAFLAKYRVAVIVAAGIIVAGGAAWYVHSATPPSFAEMTVAKGNVVESVDEPGSVATEHSAQLSFQEGGQISSVDVNEGSVVGAGQVLATLDSAQLQAAAEQADAAVAAAQAKLDSLKSGTRPEQLQIDESALASAKNSLAIAVTNTYTSLDDAILNQTDNLFLNPKSSDPIFNVQTGNSQTANDLSAARVQIGNDLFLWYGKLSAQGADPASLSGTADAVLAEVQQYLATITLAVNSASAAANTPASTLAAYKAYVGTATAEVQASASALSGAESGVTSAENQLTLANAGATPQDIEAQQALVAQAQAAASGAHVALAHAALVAPFGGTVQGLTAQAGQVVGAGTPVLTLVNQSGLKIETYVSQADVAKIQAGDKASVTLDAFGTGTVFPATVTTVDPGETQVNGVSAYLVTLHFTNPDSRIKDGMTANVHIITAEHDGVVEVPSNLIIGKNGTSSFVLVPSHGGQAEQPVQTGITGDDGMTEIVSGLSAGDKIVSF